MSQGDAAQPAIGEKGYAVVAMHDRLTPEEFAILTAVYDDELALDEWLPAGSRSRKRSYQRFSLTVADLRFEPEADPGPYIQSMSVNPLQGGIERIFRVISPEHPVTAVTRKLAHSVAADLVAADVLNAERTPEVAVDVHFIRIAAPGEPAPEGIHRDGLLGGSVHLVHRENITGGLSEVYDNTQTSLAEFQLDEPLKSLVFDDSRVLHYTHPILPADPDCPSYRDVLLIGFR
ncbi:2OG-Fe dioxygenase family protein [Nocardia sp. 2]|uniref:2OG-Fe dioxygenase family protein n=1 Tax=Nocardia acididurans TaxID=2802282 RepID=A0ABS1M5H6_9NOCA|nr:2OG-Fe dioxygenase family protein [Nocardia acididurans]MBL1075794.1 2OG-Fe dioxygenase family protein [Nocardia acididurans]